MIPIVQVVEVPTLTVGLFDLDQKVYLSFPHHPNMNAPEGKPDRGKEAQTEAEASRSAERRKIIEQYADDLREVLKKLRKRMH